MEIIIISILIIFAFIASFVALGISTYNRNMKKTEHDLLKFIRKKII